MYPVTRARTHTHTYTHTRTRTHTTHIMYTRLHYRILYARCKFGIHIDIICWKNLLLIYVNIYYTYCLLYTIFCTGTVYRDRNISVALVRRIPRKRILYLTVAGGPDHFLRLTHKPIIYIYMYTYVCVCAAQLYLYVLYVV